MREDSPVLKVLRENPNADLVSCRWCGKKGHQADWRWFRWGANGFCSKSCFDLAIEAFDGGDKDWWKTKHIRGEAGLR